MKVLIVPTGLMFFLKAVGRGSMKAQYWHACVASNAPRDIEHDVLAFFIRHVNRQPRFSYIVVRSPD